VSLDVEFSRLIDATPEEVFDAFTDPECQEAFYGKDDAGWIVESHCDLRVGGEWTIAFGPSRHELYRHRHVFEVIERPQRLVLASTETRLDGSSFHTTLQKQVSARTGDASGSTSRTGEPSGNVKASGRRDEGTASCREPCSPARTCSR
jgi:uncharacterized protein YndB with AHSA1/START domain